MQPAPEDERARHQAVDTRHSVIVQAPAGSGKTTLLVERYLALLAEVEAPEEILAITFTRKAAAEMRERILRYLHPDFASDAPHEQAPLAKASAIRDRVAGWGLRQNPQRFLIRTIDSFNHFLARTMPVASALGPVPAPADNTQALYRQAARNVLALHDGQDDLAADLTRLLDWRDHRSQDIEDLLADLLGRREQWLRAFEVAGPADRRALEAVLDEVIGNRLRTARQQLEQALAVNAIAQQELLELLRYAAGVLHAKDAPSPIRSHDRADRLPAGDTADLPRWAGLAEALLTREGNYRRSVTVGQGFPPKTPEKARFEALLEGLRGDLQLADTLHRARALPSPRYREDEWTVLAALIRVLVRTATELELLFARSGRTDFTGLGQAALRGLGSDEHGYTDLGLYLDRRIRHVLVDEFQDTNWAQLHLLEKLTAGWEPGDGRTLFLVGDPMQSIYRFREAEVGLFMRSRARGIGQVRLRPLRLTRNFRSRAEIVHWVNERIGPAFPEHEDIAAGAVSYAPSDPARGPGGAVSVLAHADEHSEAEALAELIGLALAERAADTEFRAAVIVRARSHLRALLPALARRGIPYRAVKLDPLLRRPVVQDLLALTRVILQPADRAALLAVLRSPVCGLTLADLHALAGDGRAPEEDDALSRVSADGSARAARVFGALADARHQRRRRSVRDLVEGAWLRLGGPELTTRPTTDLQDAEAYLQALAQAESEGLLDDWNDFAELLSDQHTEGDPPDESVRLEILTMHGAKGLEWDLVVLPALHKRPNAMQRTLLHWLPFTDHGGHERVLLAPLRSAEEGKDAELVQLIRDEQRARERYESQRLLYVAATRARERLVLSATLAANDDGVAEPARASLLEDLWPTSAADFVAALAPPPPDAPVPGPDGSELPVVDQALRRIASGWSPPVAAPLDWTPSLPPRQQSGAIEYFWAGLDARRSGTVLHRLLERVGRLGIEHLTPELRMRLAERIPALLQAMGARGDALDRTAAIVREAFERTLDSDVGRWLLSGQHAESACELAVSGVVDGQLVNAVVDRTFVADGVRWIVDYKSGYHAGADLDGFVAQEAERYSEQLSGYRRLFEGLGDARIVTALFLPRHGRLQIVEP